MFFSLPLGGLILLDAWNIKFSPPMHGAPTSASMAWKKNQPRHTHSTPRSWKRISLEFRCLLPLHASWEGVRIFPSFMHSALAGTRTRAKNQHFYWRWCFLFSKERCFFFFKSIAFDHIYVYSLHCFFSFGREGFLTWVSSFVNVYSCFIDKRWRYLWLFALDLWAQSELMECSVAIETVVLITR